MKTTDFIFLGGLACLLALATSTVQAQSASDQPPGTTQDEISAENPTPTESAAEAAKQLANPVASLISVPFQDNIDVGLGANHDGVRNTLDIQPVIPLKLNEDWNVISRTILPVIEQEGVSGPGGQYGLGDITQSLFFSPTKPLPGGIIAGFGPAFLIPTATASVLGTEKVGAGPTLVLLRQDHGWTYGVLTNHIWSFAGDDHRSDVDSTFIQPFVSYTTKSALTLGINMESTYDWNADQWTIPINLTASQVVKIGGQLMSIGIGGRSYVERPNNGPDWGARLTVTFLFPEKR